MKLANRRVNSLPHAQRGVVLIMSLILLIVISLVATLAIRASISGEQVSKSLRTHTAAFQAAETALRYCEDQILRHAQVGSGASAKLPHPVPADGTAPALWSSRANWVLSAGKAVEIDAAAADSSDSAARSLPVRPRCMVEKVLLQNDGGGAARDSFVVTAVGFSRDYRTSAAGKPISGGEAWLQSTVTP